MNKIKAYIVGIIIVLAGIIPPIPFVIKAPSAYWHWWVLIAGFLAFYTLFIKTSLIIRIMVIGGFLNCFFSVSPYICFTTYISYLGACYFFILCYNLDRGSIKSFGIPLLQCLMFFWVFFYCMQLFERDTLLNFGRQFNQESNYCFGVTGQHMQSASASVILAGALLPYNSANMAIPFFVSVICNSAGSFLCASLGLISYISEHINRKKVFSILLITMLIFLIWATITHKISANTSQDNGRLVVWKKSISIALQRPWFGWGIGSYKGIFPSLSRMHTRPWMTTHNDFIQILFELGATGFVVVCGYFIYLFASLFHLMNRAYYRKEAYKRFSALIMITSSMMIHFPTRQFGAVLVLIFFLADSQRFIDSTYYTGR